MKKIIYLILTFLLLTGTCFAEENPTEIQKELEKEFNTYFPNGEINLNTYNPTDEQVFFDILSIKATEQNINNLYYHNRLSNCNENFTECDATIKKHNGTTGYYTYTQKIKINYAELNPKVSKKVNKLIDNYKTKYADKIYGNNKIGKDIRITDLDLLNYFYYSFKEGDDPTNKEVETLDSLNFITELKKDFEHGNIKYKFITNGCDINVQLFSDSHTSGTLFLYYEDIIYGGIPIDMGYNNIIYVPTNTPTDEESTLNAAKKRLNKYFGKDFDITISRETKIDNDNNWAVGDGDITRFGDMATMSKYIYKLNINGIEYEFLIIRDSSKMIDGKYKSKDLKNDISVTLVDDSIPFDTLISSENIEKNEEYKKIIGKNNVHTYDISLHSRALNSIITKTERGTFTVSIPVPENLQGKKIVAYFINERNELEEYEVKVEGGFATFETNHFSVYSLSEKEEKIHNATVKNPLTFDNIYIILITTCLSLIISVKLIYEKKKMTKEI